MKKLLFLPFFFLVIQFQCFSQNISLEFSYYINQKRVRPEKKIILNDSSILQISLLKNYFTYSGPIDSKAKLTDRIQSHLFDLTTQSSRFWKLTKYTLEKSVPLFFGVDSTIQQNGIGEGLLDPVHGMYWTWQSGYIHFKMEGSIEIHGTKKNVSLHLGGFLAPHSTLFGIEIPVKKRKAKLEFHLDSMLLNLAKDNLWTLMRPCERAVTCCQHLKNHLKIR
jgi:hypothetical protein